MKKQNPAAMPSYPDQLQWAKQGMKAVWERQDVVRDLGAWNESEIGGAIAAHLMRIAETPTESAQKIQWQATYPFFNELLKRGKFGADNRGAVLWIRGGFLFLACAHNEAFTHLMNNFCMNARPNLPAFVKMSHLVALLSAPTGKESLPKTEEEIRDALKILKEAFELDRVAAPAVFDIPKVRYAL